MLYKMLNCYYEHFFPLKLTYNGIDSLKKNYPQKLLEEILMTKKKLLNEDSA